MSELEEKLGAILNNPQMLSQIMSMAQAMSAQQQKQDAPAQQPPQAPPPPPPQVPEFDITALQKLSGLATQSSVDRDQQALLKALSPYLHKERLNKLERAMRAAKLARFASAAFGQGGLQSLLGR